MPRWISGQQLIQASLLSLGLAAPVAGQEDVLWHHQVTGDLYVWFLGGTNGVVTQAGSYLTPQAFTDTRWQIRGVGDFNQDGKADILWHHQVTGDLYVWFLGGTNGVVTTGGSYLTPQAFTDTRWQIRGVADFNQDGKADILWHHQVTGDLYVWFLGGTNGVVTTGGSYLTPQAFTDTRWQIRGVADFNQDGRPDLLWHHQTTGDLYVWFLGATNGVQTMAGSYLTPRAFTDTRWQIRGVADFNQDGKPDVLWHHQTTGDLYVWFLNGTVTTSGSYLTPRAFTDTRWQIRGVANFNRGTAPDLKTALVSGDTLTLRWTFSWPSLAGSNDEYQLEYSTSPNSGWATLITYACTSSSCRNNPYAVTIPLASGTWYYRVRARTGTYGFSAYSQVRAATRVPTYTLTVGKTGTGSGTVTGTGITCGTDCAEVVPSGTVVTLTATPAAGSTFFDWSGCTSSGGPTCSVTVTSNRTVTATFNGPPTYTLSVAKAGTGSGTVTGTGISCGTDCTETVVSGTTLTLTATPAAGSTFTSWSGCTSTSGATCSVTVTSSRTVTATFTAQQQTSTFNPQYDNVVLHNSLDSSWANTVYRSGELMVGSNWYENLAGYSVFAGASLVRFDLSALAGKTITSATLTLEVQTAGVGSAPRTWSIQALSSSWSQYTVTWNVAAGLLVYTNSRINLNPPTSSGQMMNINVTSTVGNWASGAYANNGLLFSSNDYVTYPGRTSFDMFSFYSLEDGGQGWPKLTVTYR